MNKMYISVYFCCILFIRIKIHQENNNENNNHTRKDNNNDEKLIDFRCNIILNYSNELSLQPMYLIYNKILIH